MPHSYPDKLFEKEQIRILEFVLDPTARRTELLLQTMMVFGYIFFAASLFFSALRYITEGVFVFPWWALIVLAGGVASLVLIDSAPNDGYSYEIEQTRNSEIELYTLIETDLKNRLEAKVNE